MLVQIKKQIGNSTQDRHSVCLYEFRKGHDEHLRQRVVDDFRSYGYHVYCDSIGSKRFSFETYQEEVYVKAWFSRSNIIV